MEPSSRLRRLAALTAVASAALAAASTAEAQCTADNTVTASVVAIDQPLVWNRLGAQNVNGMMYALRRDVIDRTSRLPITAGGSASPGGVELRHDKRPRPLVLRVAEGGCLTVHFQNLLAPAANPVSLQGVGQQMHPLTAAVDPALQIDDQVAERVAGFHANGLELVGDINADGSYVGQNPNSLVPPGGSATYTLYAPREGAYLVVSPGALFGGEGTQGTSSTGLFGVVNVEPKRARAYRSQLTDEELRLATRRDANGAPMRAPGGQPILDYDALYPAVEPWISEGKAGLPIVRMLTAAGELVHSDLNAVIAGTGVDANGNPDGSFLPDTYPLESVGKNNPVYPQRLQAFREYTSVFHDEVATAQAFPGFFNDPVFRYTLHGVRDSFMINYGSGGIGSEIIANRLGVGPMHDCLDCAYEEFFLTSFTVGDPAMLVDIPANIGLERLAPGQAPPAGATGPKATKALYPDDPSNVHHGYTGDSVKVRNVHVGKEHHVFHLHNHQWLFNPNDDNANYLDAQGLGPGSGYTYELGYGGAGNRNKTVGDAIYHCHFYPHFAQGMWAHFRNHDVFEAGTRLAVSGGDLHTARWALGDGTPASCPAEDPGCSRALPDPEILAGSPIPALVPLPGKPLAPMPGRVAVVANPNQTAPSALMPATGFPGGILPDLVPVGSNARVVDRAVNPGYPFFVAGIEEVVGQRPPTPPLDMLSDQEAAQLEQFGHLDPDTTRPATPVEAQLFKNRPGELQATAGGWDGGLQRHALDGVAAGGTARSTVSRLDFTKVLTSAKPIYYPEEGTDLEQVAMAYHAQREHPSVKVNLNGTTESRPFVVNGAPPMPSSPFSDPCIDDTGKRAVAGQTVHFFDGSGGMTTTGTVVNGSLNPRTYKGANVQIDAVFNKVGWHYPQERIVALWDDVLPTINKQKPPEPFVIRFNTFECGRFLHTNLVPEAFELDDYQVRTPTDIIGQHIHLPKWDLSTTDGAANGWNYEDGTLSPGTVRERIEAINCFNGDLHACELTGGTPGPTAPVPNRHGETILHPLPHPYFQGGTAGEWLGARTTIQRWFFDPVVNVQGVDRGLGIIFTHDHYGPSTHQQIGLYASVLAEPAGSTWVHNESGVALGTRHDGGPTTWQAVIRTGDVDRDGKDDSFREFWFQQSDFQHAYLPGVYIGADQFGRPNGVAPGPNDFRFSINPGAREQAFPILPDLVKYAPTCPLAGPGAPPVRPCPEAISAADPGMMVVNYRNEPIGLRVFDPNAPGPDGKPGTQAAGQPGDLAYAFQTRTDRVIQALNTKLGNTPYPALTNDIGSGDPFTPIMRANAGDNVRVKVQVGGHEEEHVTSINGMKWLQGGSGFGGARNSGWRNAQAQGISEQFSFNVPVTPFLGARNQADYLYTMNTDVDGFWSGDWGFLRTYNAKRPDLAPLPSNPNPPVRIRNARDFRVDGAGVCPRAAPVRAYDLTAVLANAVLPPAAGASVLPPAGDPSATMHVGGPLDPNGGTLVYNPAQTPLTLLDPQTGAVLDQRAGPLHDPTAILYVRTADLFPTNPADPGCFRTDPVTGASIYDPLLATCPAALRPGVPTEPIVVRATAGECVDVTLRNRLPALAPDLGNFQPLIAIIHRDNQDPNGVTTFNNNLIRPSSDVGLHAQLVAYDVTKADGMNVGKNGIQTAPPGGLIRYKWYVGDLSLTPAGDVVATPIEFGGSNLMPADKIKQGQKSLGGALVTLPRGSLWTEDATRRSAASVGTDTNLNGALDAGEVAYRDFATVIQKALTFRYGDSTPVASIGIGEIGGLITEDTQDAGQIAVNNGSEPLWFRFGLLPNAPIGNVPGGFGAVPNAHQAFSNTLTGADPVTPVFTAAAGQPFRMHVVEPHGTFRGTVFALHGHNWERDPYVCPGSSDLGLPGKCAPGELGSRAIGDNPLGMGFGAQDGVHAHQHFELVIPKAGGTNAVPGDYLFRDSAGFGVTNGLWGIVRVAPPAP